MPNIMVNGLAWRQNDFEGTVSFRVAYSGHDVLIKFWIF